MSVITRYRRSLAGAPVFEDTAQTRVTRSTPGLGDRVRARLHQGALDRRLAGGDEGRGGREDRELAARAWQLTRRGARERLACALDGILVELDEQPRIVFTAAVPVDRQEAEVARGELIRLAERLRDERPVAAQGVARVRRLLSDGSGPLYAPGGNDALWQALRRASFALD
jgi:hypothetical protein